MELTNVKKKVTIEVWNINKYRSNIFPHVERIKWRPDYLDGDVLKNFPNLKELDCSHNRLTTLRGIENCPQLQTLDCSQNNLTNLRELVHFTQLHTLKCHNNKITSLEELSSCVLLQNLQCYSNKLSYLHGLEKCVDLIKLNCSYNKLSNLCALRNCIKLRKLRCSLSRLKNMQGLENCTQLIELYCIRSGLRNLQGLENCTRLRILLCFENKITSLQGLENCIRLQKLDCSKNQLTNLQGLSNLTQLEDLDCSSNRITNLLPIVYLVNIDYLEWYDNYLNLPTIQEERFLQRLQNRRTNQTIYNDRQNVHNTTIQKSILQSTTNLLKDPKPDKPNITQLSVQSQTLLQSYFQDTTPHSVLLITYEELFSYVWARIQQSPHKDTLVCILEQELKDSTNLCYTGRFNRTINTLNGFYNDIIINISDPDRINAIIHQHQTKDDIIRALQEAGYDQQTIENWTTDL